MSKYIIRTVADAEAAASLSQRRPGTYIVTIDGKPFSVPSERLPEVMSQIAAVLPLLLARELNQRLRRVEALRTRDGVSG